MSEPLIFVSRHAVNDGELERVKALSEEFRELVEEADTGLVAYHFHVSDDGREVSSVQVHADAASMDAYLPLVEGKLAQALSLLETRRIEVFGTPGPVVANVLERNAEHGVAVTVTPGHLAGFSR
jgi:hypothetical protein